MRYLDIAVDDALEISDTLSELDSLTAEALGDPYSLPFGSGCGDHARAWCRALGLERHDVRCGST